MEREELLKVLIKQKYNSVLQFSKESGIPESSIRNIFSRGLDSVNAGTLVTICKMLEVETDALMTGTLKVNPNPQKDRVWADYCSNPLPPDALPVNPTHTIPLLGQIAAGVPIYAEENVEGYIWTDRNHGAEYFGLRVRGNSMDAAHINDGDIVIVRRQDIVEDGEIAVVLVDDDATIKRYHREGDTIILSPQSTDPTNRTQIYNLKEHTIRVLGRVMESRTEY